MYGRRLTAADFGEEEFKDAREEANVRYMRNRLKVQGAEDAVTPLLSKKKRKRKKKKEAAAAAKAKATVVLRRVAHDTTKAADGGSNSEGGGTVFAKDLHLTW